MVDSTVVLWGQTLAYTLYAIVMILVVGWVGWRLTKPGKGGGVKPALFFTFVAFLTVLGVSLHLITLKTIPWVEPDLHRASARVDKTFEIRVANHHSMVFQMQVVPGHKNDVIWRFTKPGLYSIRSTEYSGPKGAQMIIPDVIEVLEAK